MKQKRSKKRTQKPKQARRFKPAKRPKPRPPVFGLTGGVGAGKSLAAQYFKEAGVTVIDADALARELRQPPGKAAAKIKATFGTTDRGKLRKIIFSDPLAKKKLENILHPLIWEEVQQRIREAAKKNPKLPILYEAALLIETGRYQQLEGLIVVHAPTSVRLERLMARDSIDRNHAEKIIQAQVSDEVRKNLASCIIENVRSPSDLKAQIEALVKKWTN